MIYISLNKRQKLDRFEPKQNEGAIMQRLRNKMNSSLLIAILAVAIGAVSVVPAFAITNKADCDAAVAKANQDLLKANVSSDKLAEIFNLIEAARASCGTEAFADAAASLATANQQISSAAAQ